MKKRTTIIIAIVLALSMLPLSALATQDDAARYADNLFATINTGRAAASKPAYVRSEGLDRIAAAYATILVEAGADFRRTTDYRTLPNGERVISLAAANNVRVSGFSYSVYYNKNYKFETSAEFAKKVTSGDYTRVGIAFVTGADGATAIVVIYDKSPI